MSELLGAAPQPGEPWLRNAGLHVLVSPASDYLPAQQVALELLGAPATAEVSFLFDNDLDDEGHLDAQVVMITVAAQVCADLDATAVLEFQGEDVVMRRASGGPVVLFGLSSPSAESAVRATLDSVGVAYHVSGEPGRRTGDSDDLD